MANGIAATAEEKGQFIMPDNNQHIETLHNIELEVPRGKLIGICGSVGSGKSSLLSAIMGDVSVCEQALKFPLCGCSILHA
jgi:ABC-type branched-chain amino acid transport systems, ATPase component